MYTIKEQYTYSNRLHSVIKRSDAQRVEYDGNVHEEVTWFTYGSHYGYAGVGMLIPALKTQSHTGKKALVSHGPWWVDSNHLEESHDDGNLSLIYVLPVSPKAPFTNMFCPGICYPELEGMKISGTLRGHKVDLKGANLVFWCQFKNPQTGLSYNYVLSGQPITQALHSENPTKFEINIDTIDDSEWTWLGACKEKANLYGKQSIKESIESCDIIGLGFVVYGFKVNYIWEDEKPEQALRNINITSRHWPVDPLTLPTGTISLSDLKIAFNSCHEVRIAT